MTFIKPLDKDIYNFYEEAIGIKKIVLGLLQERYAGEFSNIYADLRGQSAEYKVTSLDQFMEILPSLERIQNLLRRAMDEATGKRQKLEYPLGKFLKEKYPEMTVQNLQDSPIQSLVLSEWEHELRRRYPEIEEAYKNLPKVQSVLQEPLRILIKIRDWRDQELAKLESSTKKAALHKSQNENIEKIFNLTKFRWKTEKRWFEESLEKLQRKELITNTEDSIQKIFEMTQKIELKDNSYPELFGLLKAWAEMEFIAPLNSHSPAKAFLQDVMMIFTLPNNGNKIRSLESQFSKYITNPDEPEKQTIEKITRKFKECLT
ncbi:MAG TPA: hypothetical protein PL180_17305 [Spirochaetota bacterium]|nr:hypothetical protein [Spirochaetota bacterium]